MSDLQRLSPEEEGGTDVVHVEQESAAHELEGVGDPEQQDHLDHFPADQRSSIEITPFRFVDDVLEEEVEDHECALEAGGLQDVVAVLGLPRGVGTRAQQQLGGLKPVLLDS